MFSVGMLSGGSLQQAGAISLDALRARIRAIEGVQVQVRRVASGIDAIDGLIGGLPSPGLIELVGVSGSGSTRLALAVAAAFTRRQQRVCWVDQGRELYPPAVHAHGVELSHTLVLRPPADRAVWAAEQVLRSGCFGLVVLARPVLTRWAGQRWAHAAEQGGSAAIVLTEQAERSLSAPSRLRVAGGEVVVLRDRSGGRPGTSRALPTWPEGASPWD